MMSCLRGEKKWNNHAYIYKGTIMINVSVLVHKWSINDVCKHGKGRDMGFFHNHYEKHQLTKFSQRAQPWGFQSNLIRE